MKGLQIKLDMENIPQSQIVYKYLPVLPYLYKYGKESVCTAAATVSPHHDLAESVASRKKRKLPDIPHQSGP